MASHADLIQQYFRVTPLLARLCVQNGWPDTETLRVETQMVSAQRLICNVSFDEILMGGAGCVAGRVARWGQFELRTDVAGGVLEARPL